MDIWQTQISSNVPIVIDATFADLGSSGLLGSAGSSATRTLPNIPRASTWFPFPTANKIAGREVGASFGPTTSHIRANFNSTANWSYATDGIPQAGRVDFISVVLHEVGHGLGFLGSASVNSSGLGSVGASGSPYIFDVSVVDSAGTSILNAASYPDGSAGLASLLTGTGLSGPGIFWNGAGGLAASAGSGAPRLYSPPGYQGGSTYSHLDDATYPPGNINSLMTHAIGSAEVIHTPGPIVNGMFADMGGARSAASA